MAGFVAVGGEPGRFEQPDLERAVLAEADEAALRFGEFCVMEGVPYRLTRSSRLTSFALGLIAPGELAPTWRRLKALA